MSDQTKIAEMLDHLVNDDTAKAEELFHEYVVEKSREIYENLIESEVEDEEVDEATDEDDEAVEEASEDSDDDEVTESEGEDDEEVEEGFDEVEMEADDETDDLEGDLEMGDEEEEEGDEEAEEGDEDEEATKGDIMDLKTAIEDLEAAFKEYADGEEGEGDMDDMDMKMGDDFSPEMDEVGDLATVREYVEKVDGHGAEKKGKAETADNTSSPVAGSNDMGGTTSNIAKGGEGGGSETGLTGKPQQMNTKNINTVGGSKESERMSKDGKGHGAEKSGAGEGAADATSVIGSK
jgi:hypothetical protein